MKTRLTSYYLLLALFTLAMVAITGSAQTTKTVKQTNAHHSDSWSGDQLYREFCAVCHGIDAKGSGPAASALKSNPTDLTQIARRNGNKFNELRMRSVIGGGEGIVAHGA